MLRATGGRPYGENGNRLLGAFGFRVDSTDRAGYGKLFSSIGEDVCLPDVFSQNAKIPLLFYLRRLRQTLIFDWRNRLLPDVFSQNAKKPLLLYLR